ncbi:TPA: tail assembly chaperone, partial [Staphylococcus aureus]
QASIGQGVSMLPVGLESGNPVVIGEVLIASTSHLKKQAITINNIDEALDEIAENIGLEEFGSDILTELGKRPMTRNLVEVVETE